jgi:superfamily II DNA/RNA helicase
MSFSTAELEASINEAVTPGFREKLLARGQSRAMIWRDGELPPDAPVYSQVLSYDLLAYGYSLLSHGLRLVDGQGNEEIARVAFEHAGEALESVAARGTITPERDFHRLVAAASYHLGRFSARAYSLLHAGMQGANLSTVERCLGRLMMRDLDGLDQEITNWGSAGGASDESLRALVATAVANANAENQGADQGNHVGEGEEPFAAAPMEALDLALTDGFLRALATALLAFERGEVALLNTALARLAVGLEGAAEFSLVNQWWSHKLARHLLRDLWDMSFHARLPLAGAPDGSEAKWQELRSVFIASLYRRGRSEIELWPSQVDAAKRVLELNANLVLSLPTSAGKTRIAELCILACLATSKRVVFVTPLRALSAQTETSLQRTFLPLGKTVSSLYGSIGASGADIDALRERDIIVATPEKLDFALRNDPNLLDDVGLVVLDEGHMIGLNEREVRYEAQIQRLLRRPDAAARRIVCLSAILPEGEQLDDFVGWLTSDKPDGLIQKKWRPTRLRFGEINWKNGSARLSLSVGDEKPFVPKFFTAAVPPVGKRTTPFPKDQRELCLATAWRLVEDGQTVLIFCPMRASVEPFATAIVDLHARGALVSVFDAAPDALDSALAIGAEWLGVDHVLLQCLKLGVAVHHGALPSPYRKEVERLLQAGVLKVTISSPTLAQGLNLSATALVFHGLTRYGESIEISEFRNVVGRAGRAYIDVEGLVLLPIFKDQQKNQARWKALIDDHTGRQMQSGLFRLIVTLLLRMGEKIGSKNIGKLLEYVAGNGAWAFPEVAGESEEDSAKEKTKWQGYLTSLDTAILSLLGDQEVAYVDIEKHLEVALASSLFNRVLARREQPIRDALNKVFAERAKVIWNNTTSTQRRGYFLSGVGLETGLVLDAKAKELEQLLITANAGLVAKAPDVAVGALTALAEILFSIPPFVPKVLPDNWKQVLAVWLSGEPVSTLPGGSTEDVLRFVEEGLIYKLPWGMEAVRVRGLAHVNPFGEELDLSAYELGLAVATVETGTMDRSASYLMQAGFGSRLAAIQAVADGGGEFTKGSELLLWLRSPAVEDLGQDPSWPSPETHRLWKQFVSAFDVPAGRVWTRHEGSVGVTWLAGKAPAPGSAVRIGTLPGFESHVFGADYEHIGDLAIPSGPGRKGLLLAKAGDLPGTVDVNYVGPN